MSAANAVRNPLTNRFVGERMWFPLRLDLASGKLTFVLADRETIAEQPFLEEERWNTRDLPHRQVDLQDVLAVEPAQPAKPRINFVWHTAFCCSTLISRALDRPGCNFSLREPSVLMAMADAKRDGQFEPGKRHAHLPEAMFAMFDQPFFPDAQVTVKPTNAANTLLAEAATLTDGKMLFLYSDCRSFLISLAKRSEHGRSFARRLFTRIAGDGNAQAQWPMQKLFELSDLEIGALVWHMQIAEFQRVTPMLSEGRVASLDCDAFLAAPRATLEALDSFFGYRLGSDHIDQLLRGPLLQQDPKKVDTPFEWRQRLEEKRDIGSQIGKVLDDIVAWSYDVCPATPRDEPLPWALLPLSKTYAC